MRIWIMPLKKDKRSFCLLKINAVCCRCQTMHTGLRCHYKSKIVDSLTHVHRWQRQRQVKVYTHALLSSLLIICFIFQSSAIISTWLVPQRMDAACKNTLLKISVSHPIKRIALKHLIKILHNDWDVSLVLIMFPLSPGLLPGVNISYGGAALPQLSSLHFSVQSNFLLPIVLTF